MRIFLFLIFQIIFPFLLQFLVIISLFISVEATIYTIIIYHLYVIKSGHYLLRHFTLYSGRKIGAHLFGILKLFIFRKTELNIYSFTQLNMGMLTSAMKMARWNYHIAFIEPSAVLCTWLKITNHHLHFQNSICIIFT